MMLINFKLTYLFYNKYQIELSQTNPQRKILFNTFIIYML